MEEENESGHIVEIDGQVYLPRMEDSGAKPRDGSKACIEKDP
jgi:hypothetical protein